MQRVARRLIAPAIIAWIFCPPVGTGALVGLWMAMVQLNKGESDMAMRLLERVRKWIRFTIYFTLAGLVVASVIIYLMGPRIITAMGSFY